VQDGSPGEELEIRRSRNGGQARDWGLVLSAVGIPSRVLRDSEGFALYVRGVDAPRAEAELSAYAEDVATRNAALARRRRSRAPEATGPAPVGVAFLTTLAMIAFHGWTGPARASSAWYSEGSADVTAMGAGELWRAVTALCLHADLGHLTANALFLTFFLAAVGRSLGAGLALALVLLAGAGGNGVNAFLRSTEYVSLGASTAVFGAVGLLSGLGVVRRVQRGDRWRLALLPFAGGLGILAMVGSGGGRVDVFAHLFGLLVGTGLGLGVALVVAKPPATWVQVACGAGAVLAVLGCWRLAL
jgi:membrane associated rhomboid family serine protease